MRCALTALPLLLVLACGDNSSEAPLPPIDDPLDWVDPTIGTGGFGFAYGSAFVGAAAPHGLVKLGPDTSGEFGTVGFQHYSGYFADDDVIESFSHMHLHGAGLPDYGVIGVMPTLAFDPAKTAARDYRDAFAKDSERAQAGRYEVTLTTSQIRVELTATPRGAHHRYTFPANATPTLVIDLLRTLEGGAVSGATLTLDEAAQTITGRLHNDGAISGGSGGHDVFFAARTRAPWIRAQSWTDGAALEFGPGALVELQIGVSLTSAAGALANLEAELPEWDWDATAEATADAWRTRLEAIIVEGGTIETRRIFYSSLYKSFLMPTIISDVDGGYVYEGAPGTVAVGEMVSDLSLWDTYRTLHPLYHLIAPSSGADAARSLVAMGEAGQGFPRWPIGGVESGTMLGASADVVLADAAIKLPGIDGFDADAVLETLVTIATDPTLTSDERGGRSPADDYIELGYVPSTANRSVSTNLEFATDDHAIARMAESLGRTDIAAMFDTRASSFEALFDERTGTFRPRGPDGAFGPIDGYDPLEFGEEFAEANAIQMLWAPLHDVPGLSELLGGDDVLVTTLEAFFASAATDLAANPLDAILANAGPRLHYWHGNEPDIHAAYLFGQVGRDDLTQTWLRWIQQELYSDQPAGLAGNDDGGTLSSWYVWTALGIYPIAGSARYVIGLPLFPRVSIRTPTGTLVIEAPGLSERSRGVSGVSLDGVALERAEIDHGSLAGDATLTFEVADAPTAWSRN